MQGYQSIDLRNFLGAVFSVSTHALYSAVPIENISSSTGAIPIATADWQWPIKTIHRLKIFQGISAVL